MNSFWRKSPPEPGILVKKEKEFDFESDPEYDIMENQIELDNMTEDELKAEVHYIQKAEVQDIQKAEVQVKSEQEADIWIKGEPDVGMKYEQESDIEIKMEFETDPETELEFGAGTKSDDSMVRIFIVYCSNLIENLYPLKLIFYF